MFDHQSFPAIRFALFFNALAALLSITAPNLAAQHTSEPRFESHIVPILEANCVVCHGEQSPQAELDVRTREALLEGGKSGPALVPGAPVDSLFLQKTASGAMPMGDQKLAPAEVELIRLWIEGGALLEGETAGAAGGLHTGLSAHARSLSPPSMSSACCATGAVGRKADSTCGPGSRL